jgi:hypothetical protein
VQAICDFVHNHIVFGYEHSRPTRTAFEAYEEQRGVCRDYAHLAIAFCRCLNIPARYCTSYISDIGLPPPYAPMDFAAWIEVYLGHRWYAFDPRNNAPRIGRILIAHGRDAADVPLTHTSVPESCQGSVFGPMKKRPQNNTLPSKARYFPSNVLAVVQHDRHLFLPKKKRPNWRWVRWNKPQRRLDNALVAKIVPAAFAV